MFITNNSTEASLFQELVKKIPYTEELKILVGYFYFSGMQDLLKEIFKNEKLRIRVLVGMNADVYNGSIVELPLENRNLTSIVIKKNYKESIKKIFTQAEFDNREFLENIRSFLDLIRNGRLEIRKTREPNHAKLYIFKTLQAFSDLQSGFFITGSSNLSRSGLHERNEFNVAIKDYGYEQAVQYFDDLWQKAIPFYPDDLKEIAETFEQHTLIRSITPFEAYLLVLKTYLDAWKQKDLSDTLQERMVKAGFRPFRYQLDAIGQALQILEIHGGVVIADVVGLGKSVIASSIAHELRTRGVVIVPPGLMGADDKSSGWKKYLEDFGLASMGWEVHSLGKLEQVLEIVRRSHDFGAVIVDEAHRFRNEDTQSYALLKEICRNKKVILLTATPFNNRPSDIFALLKLFVTPKQSTITFEQNLEATFSHYGYVYDEMLYIKKNLLSEKNKSNEKKEKKIRDLFKKYFQTTEPDLTLVDQKLRELSSEIKSVLMPVMIRRNRMDLQKHPLYAKDVEHLSVVADPKKGFFELNKKQSEFYDRVIGKYFASSDEDRVFTGAIYLPYRYLSNRSKDERYDKIENFDQLFQNNLFDLMRRLVVKRFESSFGSFAQTLKNFIHIHQKVLQFVQKTGVYILDRDWINKISDFDEDEFMQEFLNRMEQIDSLETEKKGKILYKLQDLGNSFLKDIEADIELFRRVLHEMEQLNLMNADPKADAVLEKILGLRHKDPDRKVIVFTEYQDTVRTLEDYMKKNFSELHRQTLFISGNLSEEKYRTLLENFDASVPHGEHNEYSVLVCTDKLSEGFNLNRAGIIINYDIPWNPVRVIQRLGRINRIGKKMFNELYIMNFFPTERGENIIHQEKIAQSKMFMIHHSIGEDSKIFSPDEEPTASGLFTRLNTNPENLEEESTYTRVFIEFNEYRNKYPRVVNSLNSMPRRIKVGKAHERNELITVVQRNNLYFLWHPYGADSVVHEVPFEKIWPLIRCSPDEKARPLSDVFWYYYERCLSFRPVLPDKYADNSLFAKAKNKLKELIRNKEFSEYSEFMELLLDDIHNYGTLPDFRLRQIAQIQTPDDVFRLKEELGQSYLTFFTLKQNRGHENIIISIENQSK